MSDSARCLTRLDVTRLDVRKSNLSTVPRAKYFFRKSLLILFGKIPAPRPIHPFPYHRSQNFWNVIKNIQKYGPDDDDDDDDGDDDDDDDNDDDDNRKRY